MDHLVQDLRFALRSLRASPLVSVAAVVSLALGIGAVAAIFGAVDVFMLRPLDYEEGERLVAVWTTDPERGWTESSSSLPDFLDWRERSRTMELAAYGGIGLNLSGTDRPERLSGYRVSHNFFELLRERPLLGRTFRSEEEEPGHASVAVLGEGVWQRSFGGDPAIVGRTLDLDGRPVQVIGVMPDDFAFAGGGQDIWVPFEVSGDESRGGRFLRVVGRLRPGSTPESAERELAAIQAELAESYPDTNAGKGANVVPLRDDWFDEGFRQGSLIAATAVVFVLLIACANVANLLLARGAARGREIALRAALGAGRGRIVTQFLTESLVLASVGGVLGVGVAYLGIEGIRSLFPPFVPGVDGVVMNERVLGLTLGVTLLSGVVFGLAPTLQASRPDLTGALGEGGRGGESRRGGRLRRSLVAAEIGLSVVLLVSATLLVKAYVQVRSNDLGYRIDDLVAMRIQLPDTKYGDDEAVVAFQRRLVERLRALPGVVAAGASHTLPMRSNNVTTYGIVGDEVPTEGREPAVSLRIVTPGYVEAMGTPLVEGRLFDDDDVEAAPGVLLVNERFAAQHWGEESPLGQRVRLGEEEWEVVGVVGDTRDWGPDSTPGRMVYLPAWQNPQRGMNLVVHTGADPGGLIASVRETVRAMDPDQPVYDAATMTEITREQMSGNMAMVKVLGVLALVAFVLSAVGVYGVMAYSVARRTREMGVRVALGATAVHVRRLVVRQGLLLASLGIAGGALLALAAARGLSFFLFGLSPYDPVAYAAVVGVLLVTAVAASWVPAVRATRVDPVEVLST